ncbi:MAG: hypothetical protein RBR59_03280 [Sulfurimonadaceae bacterium]|jgi:hypothetical protein|nr:hypothetical protein [Sulfurimonadaceae bacterium]
MKIYYYAETGHRVGLDRFRRAAAIIKSLQGADITLLCSDFRIASVAKDYGVEKCVGIDVIRNIPQIAHNGDKLILDSSETNPTMLQDMRGYFSTFIRLSDREEEQKEKNEFLISIYTPDDTETCHGYAVDEDFYNYEGQKDINLTYFFGDDDYHKELESNFAFVDGLDAHLQLGFYYFLDYETMLEKHFKSSSTFLEYKETIQRSKILLSASPQAILESLACANKPIYFQRTGYKDDFVKLFEELNIPIVKDYNRQELDKILAHIKTHKYYKREHKSNKIANFIKQALKL